MLVCVTHCFQTSTAGVCVIYSQTQVCVKLQLYKCQMYVEKVGKKALKLPSVTIG